MFSSVSVRDDVKRIFTAAQRSKGRSPLTATFLAFTAAMSLDRKTLVGNGLNYPRNVIVQRCGLTRMYEPVCARAPRSAMRGASIATGDYIRSADPSRAHRRIACVCQARPSGMRDDRRAAGSPRSTEGLRPSDSPTRSLARRFAGALRSRGSLARSLAAQIGPAFRWLLDSKPPPRQATLRIWWVFDGLASQAASRRTVWSAPANGDICSVAVYGVSPSSAS